MITSSEGLSLERLTQTGRNHTCGEHPGGFWAYFLTFWPGTCPNRSETAVGFTWTDFQPEPSILDPFPTIFDVFGPAWKSGLGQNMAWRGKTRPGPPSQACRFRNFFLGPIPELFSARNLPHFREIAQIMSTPLTRRNLKHFQEIQQIMSTRTQTWHSWLRQECQVWLFVDIIC